MTIWLRLLMTGYDLFVAGLVLFLAAIILALVMIFLGFPWLMLLLPISVAGLTMLQILWATRVLFLRFDSENPFEVAFPKKLLKPLSVFVNNIADELKLPQPDEIRITASDAAYVYEADDGRKILALGGMILGSYTQEALAGVIAHELAHIQAGDTALSRQLYRTGMLMAQVEYELSHQGALSQYNPLVWMLRGYHFLFALANAAHSRQQEFLADKATVELVGKQQAAAALMRLELTEAIPWLSLHHMASSAAHTGQPLIRIFQEQRQRADRMSVTEWEDAYLTVMAQTTKTFDSHPCLRERLEAMGAKPKKALTTAVNASGPSARALFPNWDAVEQEHSVRLMVVFGEMEQVKRDVAAILTGRPL